MSVKRLLRCASLCQQPCWQTPSGVAVSSAFVSNEERWFHMMCRDVARVCQSHTHTHELTASFVCKLSCFASGPLKDGTLPVNVYISESSGQQVT